MALRRPSPAQNFTSSRAVRTLLLAALLLVALPVASASAGRLLVTGHDADLHCTGSSQCGFVKTAVDYVRSGAPDPSKPVLILDRLDLDMQVALDNAYGQGVVPRRVVDPRSAEFKGLALSTSNFSAILVASDESCGGCDLNTADPTLGETPDSDAINARRDEIAAFFNAGGGIFAGSGASHGDGDPVSGPDTYYGFLPLPVGGRPVRGPFCLTDVGRSIGLEDGTTSCPDPAQRTADGTRDDINCCPTHNSFGEPASDTAIRVAERDVDANGTLEPTDPPETLIADGIASGGRIVADTDKDGVPDSSDACPTRFGTTATGCPPGTDTDKDGVPDERDRCPREPFRTDDGCALAAVVLGRTFNVQRVKGKVFVSLPAGAARAAQSVPGLKGRRFIPIEQARQVPVGSLLDTRRGTARIVAARNTRGKTQASNFLGGVFQALQSRKPRAKGLTELRLKGSSFRRCGSRGKASTVQSARFRRRVVRRLRGSGSGRFRTRGRHSSATVRGTDWTVIDRCDGTLTKVKRGKVAVRDFRRKKTILLTRGKSYFAKR